MTKLTKTARDRLIDCQKNPVSPSSFMHPRGLSKVIEKHGNRHFSGKPRSILKDMIVKKSSLFALLQKSYRLFKNSSLFALLQKIQWGCVNSIQTSILFKKGESFKTDRFLNTRDRS